MAAKIDCYFCRKKNQKELLLDTEMSKYMPCTNNINITYILVLNILLVQHKKPKELIQKEKK